MNEERAMAWANIQSNAFGKAVVLTVVFKVRSRIIMLVKKECDAIKKKRRGRDLNPGTGFPVSGFQDRCIQPLCHPSYSKSIFKVLDSFAKSVSVIFITPRSHMVLLSRKTMNTGPTFP